MKIEKGKVQVRVWEDIRDKNIFTDTLHEITDLLLLLEEEDEYFEGILDEATGNYISGEELENVRDILNYFVNEPLWTLQ